MRPPVALAVAAALSACAAARPAPSAPAAAPPPAPGAPSAALPPAAAAEAPGAAPAGAAAPEAPAAPAVEPTVRTPAQLARDAELSRRAAELVDAYQNRIAGFGGVLSHDGRTVFFGSNRHGGPQLYAGELSRPAAPPVAITSGTERVAWVTLARDGRRLLLGSERGADEDASIVAATPDGSQVVALSAGEGLHHDRPALPLRRPDLMLYTRHRAGATGASVVVQPVAGGPARVVHEEPGPARLVDASPDGARALLLRPEPGGGGVLVELDVPRGGVRRLHPPGGGTEWVRAAAYASDGKTVYVAAGPAGGGAALVALDAGTTVARARWTPDGEGAAVDRIAVSPSGDVLAARVDAGNRTEVRLLDARTLAEKVRARLPAGACELGEFTPDGRRVVASLSTPDGPGDPWAIDARTGEATRLREDPPPAAVVPVEVLLDAAPALDGRPIPLHAYLPRGRGERKLPVVVWVHGGAGATAAVRWSPRAQLLAGLGCAWVEPNVRGSAGFGRAWEEADDRERRADVPGDLEAVNRWIRAQPWADGDRIALYGGGLGGWAVLAALARQPGRWRAGVDLAGPPDLRAWLEGSAPGELEALRAELGDPEADRELFAALGPLPDAGRISAPLLVYRGEGDPRVPRGDADALVAAVRASGRTVEYVVAPGDGASLDRRDAQIELLARVARFLEEHLR